MRELTFSALLLALVSLALGATENLHRGFNENIDWKTFDDAKEISARDNKPIMLLIHKTWCGACKALKPQVVNNKAIEEFSTNYVMVNVEDEEEPNDPDFAPDGGYIPRIIFINANGKVMKEIYNEGGNKSYKYYYSNADDILKSMKNAVEQIKKAPGTTDEL